MNQVLAEPQAAAAARRPRRRVPKDLLHRHVAAAAERRARHARLRRSRNRRRLRLSHSAARHAAVGHAAVRRALARQRRRARHSHDALRRGGRVPPPAQVRRRPVGDGRRPSTVGYYSDFEQELRRRPPRHRPRHRRLRSRRPTTKWLLGVAYLNRAGASVLPIAGVIFEPRPDLRVGADLPAAARRCGRPPAASTGDERWFYVGGEFGGGVWSITRPSTGDLDLINYSDWRAARRLRTQDHRRPQPALRIRLRLPARAGVRQRHAGRHARRHAVRARRADILRASRPVLAAACFSSAPL